jgi:hypothetical protein
MTRLRKIDGSCAILALRFVSGEEEGRVIDVCMDNGFEWGRGMYEEEILAAAKDLGVRLRRLPVSRIKVRKFLKLHPRGVFLACQRDHIFAVNNGAALSRPDIKTTSMDCIVQDAWRVLKPHI